jgi:hypothetical protein
MKEIRLTRGKVALVDDADFASLNRWNWQADQHQHTWYARHTCRGRMGSGSVFMHNLIMGNGPGEFCDHRDGNGLNNQRENLRPATNRQNQQNQIHKRQGASSRFKGVSWRQDAGKWAARIRAKPVLFGDAGIISLGHFRNEEDAARAYDAAARKYFGEFAACNFPEQRKAS